MKHITLSFVLLVNFYSMTHAQDVLNNVFPQRERIWEKSCTEDIIDFVIVDATEDIITLSSHKETFYLTYQDATGQEVWSISQSLGGGRGRRVGSLHVSDNGETIVVHGGSQIEELRRTGSLQRKVNCYFPSSRVMAITIPHQLETICHTKTSMVILPSKYSSLMEYQ